MIQVDATHPDPALFRGCKSYRSQEAVTAVRLREQVVLTDLFGCHVGEVGDYLCRDRKTGCASVVPKATFEATYFTDRELDGTVTKSKPTRKMVVV